MVSMNHDDMIQIYWHPMLNSGFASAIKQSGFTLIKFLKPSVFNFVFAFQLYLNGCIAVILDLESSCCNSLLFNTSQEDGFLVCLIVSIFFFEFSGKFTFKVEFLCWEGDVGVLEAKLGNPLSLLLPCFETSVSVLICGKLGQPARKKMERTSGSDVANTLFWGKALLGAAKYWKREK